MADSNAPSSYPTRRWEVPLDTWDDLKETVRDRLERSARLGHRIAYSNLVSGLAFSGPDSHALAEMLGEIGADCLERAQPMLSALAVYISGEHRDEPGPGFYRAAKRLGQLPENASEDESRIFWALEQERCIEFWGPRRRARWRGSA